MKPRQPTQRMVPIPADNLEDERLQHTTRNAPHLQGHFFRNLRRLKQ